MVTEIVDLDLGSKSSFKIVTMEGDICSRFIEFHLSYNGEVFNLQNKSVKCRYVNGRTTEEVNLVINDRVNGVCTLEIPYRITSSAQNGKCELVISQSGEILSTIPFGVEVVKSLVERAPVESSSEFGALNDALWKIDGVNAELNNINSQLDTNKNEEKGLTYLSTTVFKQNVDFSSKYFRIPFGCVTKNGVIIAGCDIRYQGNNDQSYIDIGIARSLDGGKTWQDKKIAMRNNNLNPNYSRVMDGTILYDEDINRIYLLGNYWNTRADNWTNSNTHKDSDWDIKLCYSDDEGLNWSEPISLRDLCPSGVSQFIGGVGSGIKTSNGTLIFPIQLAKLNDNPFNVQSGIMYSTDGVNWSLSTSYVPAYTSECNVFEYRGEIYINCRQEGSTKRAIYKTSNLGSTWTYCTVSENTPQPNACMGSTIKIHTDDNLEDLILFSCVNTSTRGNLTLKVLNFDDTEFKNVVNYYNKNSDGYSCLVYDKWNKKLYSIFETQGNLQFTDLTPSLQNCYLEKSKELKSEKTSLSKELVIYITGSDENVLNEIPYKVNGKYKKVLLMINNYSGKFFLSNISSQVELYSDNEVINLNNIYIRNCPNVILKKRTVINTPFSTDYVLALENSNLIATKDIIIDVTNNVNATNFLYLANSIFHAQIVNFLHSSQTINNLVVPRDGGGKVSIGMNTIPTGSIGFIKNYDNSKCDIYVRDNGSIKANASGSKKIIDGVSGSDILPYNVTYNSYIEGVTSISENIIVLGTNSKIQSLVKNTMVLCDQWRFRTSQEITHNTTLFTLPLALRPSIPKVLTGCGLVNAINSIGVCLKIETTGEVKAYGAIPSNVEVVMSTSYSLS